ncbi:MAG: PAC2 family protein [Dehalococcoidia bacterium]|nr:PAC2 family protein [Dehalococcoidia bacterium]
MRIGAFDITDPLPALREPHAIAMLRPWVDVGSVGSLALTAVERRLRARDLGKLHRPGTFFDFTRYRPTLTHHEGQRAITVPNSYLYYAVREAPPDFIFLHLLEPHALGEDYAESVLEVLMHFQVKRYMLLGGMYDAVPHTRPLLVTGSVQGKPGSAMKLERSTYEGPTTITYLIGQLGAQQGMETASMIVHLPQYAQLEEDYSGAARILETLRSIYGLPGALVDPKRGEEQYREVSLAVASNPRLKPVIAQLEADYDARAARMGQESSPGLSPEVENFLREMGDKLGGS